MSIQLPLLNMTQSENIFVCTSLFILIAIGINFLSKKRHRSKPLLKYAAIWMIIGLILILIYSFQEEAHSIFIRYQAALFPAYVVSKNGQLVIKRSNNGHFIARAKVNKATVNFLIDTGATSVLLSLKDALNAGIDVSNLSYIYQVYTANGISYAAKSTATITIGDLEFTDFPILIGDHKNSTSLLGMSLINQFKAFYIKQDTMSLTYD